MEAFVTGGSGFLGRHLLRALVADGHGARALARSDAAAATVSAAGATPVRGDVGDTAAMEKGMAGCDVVVHAAALTDQWGPAERFHAVNVEGTRSVLVAARAAGVPRLVHVSSEAVLADGRPLVRVDEAYPRPARPVGLYPLTKGLAEDLVLKANSADLTTVAVRPRLVWGPEDASVLPILLAAVQRGRYAWIDHGNYLTSTCHVTNACEGILLAATRGAGGEVFFLTDGAPLTLREFLTRLVATQGVELPARSVPRRVAWATATVLETAWSLLRLHGEPPLTRTFLALGGQEMTVRDDKARRELGYVGHLSRDQGLADMAAAAGPGR